MEINETSQPIQETSQSPEAAVEKPQTQDIDGFSKFTFQGEEYTPDQFSKMINEHKSLSEQMKSVSEDKKYWENLELDLDSVMQDPRLADRFKQIYPKKFHGYVDKFLKSPGTAPAPQNEKPGLPPEFMNEFNQVKSELQLFKDRAYQSEVQAATAKLDSILPPLFTKFPMANEDQVYARAEAALASGTKLTEKTWERLVRESHDVMEKKANTFHAQKLKTQLEKGQKAVDSGPGGHAPGGSPPRARTFDEAQKAMIDSLRGSN